MLSIAAAAGEGREGQKSQSLSFSVFKRICSMLRDVIASPRNLGQAFWRHYEHLSSYRDRLKGLYIVARNFFLLLLHFSAWPCLAVA